MFGIFGSGFGLYGYLPAVLQTFAKPVLLPERYRETVNNRSDISRYLPQIEWRASEAAILQEATGLVIAQRPEDQAKKIEACLQYPGISRLILEKPLASTPDEAKTILKVLEKSKKIFRIGYVFRFTPWAKTVKKWILNHQGQGSINFDWQFMAHHYASGKYNWKRTVPAGGGALRFYGIHLIGLLAEWGYDRVVSSQIITSMDDEAPLWRAEFSGKSLPACIININSQASRTCFIVTTHNGCTNMPLVDLSDPFEISDIPSDGQLEDRRLLVLKALCEDLREETSNPLDWYWKAIEIWEKSEEQAKISSLRVNSIDGVPL